MPFTPAVFSSRSLNSLPAAITVSSSHAFSSTLKLSTIFRVAKICSFLLPSGVPDKRCHSLANSLELNAPSRVNSTDTLPLVSLLLNTCKLVISFCCVSNLAIKFFSACKAVCSSLSRLLLVCPNAASLCMTKSALTVSPGILGKNPTFTAPVIGIPITRIKKAIKPATTAYRNRSEHSMTLR